MYKKEGLTDGLQPSASANFSETCIIKTKKKEDKKSLYGSLYPLPFDFHTGGHIWNWLKSTGLHLTLHLGPCCVTLLPELNIWSHAENQSCRLKQLAVHIPRRFGLTARCEPGQSGRVARGGGGGDICIVSKGDARTRMPLCKHQRMHTTCN